MLSPFCRGNFSQKLLYSNYQIVLHQILLLLLGYENGEGEGWEVSGYLLIRMYHSAMCRIIIMCFFNLLNTRFLADNSLKTGAFCEFAICNFSIHISLVFLQNDC